MANKNANKKFELLLVLFLIVCAFFAGVSYSDSVKNHASWLFEPKEEEVELPDLSNEGASEPAMVDENGEALQQKEQVEPSVPVNNEAQQQAAPAN